MQAYSASTSACAAPSGICVDPLPLRTIEPVPVALWNEAASCECCSSSFGVLLRRHHCRACGRSACGKCSPTREVVVSGIVTRVRVCGDCLSAAPPANASRARAGTLKSSKMSGPDDVLVGAARFLWSLTQAAEEEEPSQILRTTSSGGSSSSSASTPSSLPHTPRWKPSTADADAPGASSTSRPGSAASSSSSGSLRSGSPSSSSSSASAASTPSVSRRAPMGQCGNCNARFRVSASAPSADYCSKDCRATALYESACKRDAAAAKEESAARLAAAAAAAAATTRTAPIAAAPVPVRTVLDILRERKE